MIQRPNIWAAEEGTTRIYYITTISNYRLLYTIEIYKYYKINVYLIYWTSIATDLSSN